jgi:hypothetical protein
MKIIKLLPVSQHGFLRFHFSLSNVLTYEQKKTNTLIELWKVAVKVQSAVKTLFKTIWFLVQKYYKTNTKSVILDSDEPREFSENFEKSLP